MIAHPSPHEQKTKTAGVRPHLRGVLKLKRLVLAQRTVNYISQNALTLLQSGADFFPALIGVIDAAKVEIFLETYIFSNDVIGQQVKDALIRAAARGVTVKVIADWIGSGRAQSNYLAAEFGRTAVQYRVFNPWFRRGVARSHRKICVVDGAVAYIGGLNLNDDLHCDYDANRALPAPRWDFAVEIKGPLVEAIHREAAAQWSRVGTLPLVTRINLYRRLRHSAVLGGAEPVLAGLVVRDNFRNRRTIQRAYLQALGHARNSVLLANPYFAPGRKFRTALALAAARGVDVTLLIGVGEFWLQDAVAHSFYPKLLKSGVKVVEYTKTQLHGKVAVVDDDWATVGSSNFDGLSLFLNQEANVVVKDADFSHALRHRIEQGIVDGTPILLEEFDHIPWYRRLFYGAAFLVYRGLMRIASLGGYN